MAARRGWGLAWLSVAAFGCYTGVPDGLDPGGEDAGIDDGASDGGDGDGDGDDGEPAEVCGGDLGPSPLRRMTRTQYDNTIRDLLGVEGGFAAALTPDERLGTFFSNTATTVTELRAEEYMRVAEDVTEAALADLPALLPCDPAVDDPAQCGAEFVDDFGPRAFRRPLTTEERSALVGLFEHGRTETSFEEGVRLVITAALQSPQFLYHLESEAPADGGDIVALGQYEVASRLSYFLWDSMPDEVLFAAAAAGELDSSEALREHADRMLDDPRAADTIATFTTQWLRIDGLPGVEKDPVVHPEFSAELRAAMTKETTRFVDYVIREGDGRLQTLLTASYSFLEGPLFDLYGITPPAGHDPTQPVELDPTQRAGLLTQASLLATHAHANQSSPIERGKIVRENFLCTPLAPPPPDVDVSPPPFDPDATTRERFDQHRSDPSCAACHELIDPIGYGFEHYDAVGAWRATEAGKPVDATGELISTADVDGPFDGAPELAAKLAESRQVSGCMVQQWLEFGLGRAPTPADKCSYDALVEEFDESDHDIRQLLVAIVASDSFRFRKVGQ